MIFSTKFQTIGNVLSKFIFLFIKFSSMMYTIIFVITFLLMLQSFLHKYCKQELLDLSLMVKMSLSNKRDMHDSLQLSWHLMFFKLFVVDFYLENPRWRIRDRFSVRTPEQYYPQKYISLITIFIYSLVRYSLFF